MSRPDPDPDPSVKFLGGSLEMHVFCRVFEGPRVEFNVGGRIQVRMRADRVKCKMWGCTVFPRFVKVFEKV